MKHKRTPEEARAYSIEYSREYRELKKRIKKVYTQPLPTPPFDYESQKEGERITCSWFGCGKTLTPLETLFGNKCLKHQNKNKNEWLNTNL